MEEIHTETVTQSQIHMNEPPEVKSVMSRKQEQEERKRQFFEDLKKAHGVEEQEPQQESRIVDVQKSEDREQNLGETLAKDESEEDIDLNAKLIPKKRFDKEIEKRKALEEQIRQERDARIKSETELSLYNKAIDTLNQKQQQTREIEPELNVVDEDAHRFYMNKINELEKKFQNQNQYLSETEKKQQFTNTVNYQAAEFQKTNPDFNEAYSYLLNIEATKGKMLGLDEGAAQNYALAQLQPLAWQAYERGQNVAELAYNISKQYGYKASAVANNSKGDLDAVDRNMKRSHSLLDTIPAASTKAQNPAQAFTSIDGFNRKLQGKFGRGVNRDEFQRALEEIRKGSDY